MVNFAFEHVYKHPWELVSHVHLTKYPSEKVKNIVGSEIIESKKGPNNQIFLKCLITCQNVLPSVFRKFKVLDVPHIVYEEDCWLDVENRLLKLKSKPVGFQDYAILDESSTFSPSLSNPNWTQFKQEGTIKITSFGRMSWFIEVFITKFLTIGARQNVNIMEELIQERLATFRSSLNY